MPTSPLDSAIAHLRTAVLLHDGAGLGDGDLLGRFLERHDEAALAALVKRHGPMVWNVCRRLLSHHDAEDAFQAAFLVLVRKAASVRPRGMVGNWLYGVAHQTALQARRTAARQRTREVQVGVMPDPAVVEKDRWPDLLPLLDEELSRLPDNYRAVLVLCDLEGRTRKEAAGQLGVPEGTVAGRLARARAMLSKRLTRRGVAFSGGALAALLSHQAASTALPELVASSTIRAASLLAAGQAAAVGTVSVKAAALTDGVLKAMFMSKLKVAVAVVLMLGFLATGATVLSCRTATAQDKAAVAEDRVKAPPKLEEENDATAWGEAAGGLQAGLGFRRGEHRPYHHGETVTLVVRIRNVGKETVKFQYLPVFFNETPPAVTDGEGKAVILPKVTVLGTVHTPVDVDLAPGKEIELTGSQPSYELKLELRPAGESDNHGLWTLYGTGKFHIQYDRVFGKSSIGSIKLDPALAKLGTGKLELEIDPAPPAASEKK